MQQITDNIYVVETPESGMVSLSDFEAINKLGKVSTFLLSECTEEQAAQIYTPPMGSMIWSRIVGLRELIKSKGVDTSKPETILLIQKDVK